MNPPTVEQYVERFADRGMRILGRLPGSGCRWVELPDGTSCFVWNTLALHIFYLDSLPNTPWRVEQRIAAARHKRLFLCRVRRLMERFPLPRNEYLLLTLLMGAVRNMESNQKEH